MEISLFESFLDSRKTIGTFAHVIVGIEGVFNAKRTKTATLVALGVLLMQVPRLVDDTNRRASIVEEDAIELEKFH